MKIELMLTGEEDTEWYHLIMESEDYLQYDDPDLYEKPSSDIQDGEHRKYFNG